MSSNHDSALPLMLKWTKTPTTFEVVHVAEYLSALHCLAGSFGVTPQSPTGVVLLSLLTEGEVTDGCLVHAQTQTSIFWGNRNQKQLFVS